ncbi:MAG: caspase family protein [Polyangiaceae bacterium]
MTGTRRALLLGSQTNGLAGVELDVANLAKALGRWDFAVTTRTGNDATRAGILAAYERLIAETQPDDAVCVYYSGHGGRLANPYPEGPRFLQYIVPTDHGAEEFRGVMSFELSALLAQLTARTPNVTVILDCCHAGQMSRSATRGPSGTFTLTPKVFNGDVSEARVKALLAEASARQAQIDVESNPDAVRLVATEPHRSAYESKLGEVSSGVFTSALLQLLDQPSARAASWGTLMLQVREQVMSLVAEQRPDVEGPRRRKLWQVEQFPDHRPLSLFFEGGSARLRGGALFGAVPNARFGVMPAGSEQYSASAALAEAVVTESLGSTARVELRAAQHVVPPLNGLLAFPLSVPFNKCQVALGAELSPELAGSFASSPYLEPVEVQADLARPSVRKVGAELVLRDARGLELLRVPEAEARLLLERLEFLARAEDLRGFAPGQLRVKLKVELGRVLDGKCLKMASSEPFYVGDRQYVSVTHEGRGTLYVAVFGIDAKYSVRLLSRSSPRGQMLRPLQTLPLGQNRGKWEGLRASWPDRLVADEARLESIIVIAADEQQDFPLLTTGDAYDLKLVQLQRATPDSPAEKRGQRGEQEEGPKPIGSEYALQRFDYQLSPTPRPS